MSEGFQYSESFSRLITRVTGDAAFARSPSSVTKHHAWEGGNFVHTFEVLRVAEAIAKISEAAGTHLDVEVIAAAAVLHDLGKVEAYELRDGAWRYAKGYTKSLHIEVSIRFARELLPEAGYAPDVVDRVIDCIGSHHGRIEWGALWEPRTFEAWALHLADMASAMIMGKSPVRPASPPRFEVLHQIQPTPYSCNQTCLAMVLGVPVAEVLKVFPSEGMTQRELMVALDRCNFWWDAMMFDRFMCDGLYLVGVPSLNFEAGGHCILVDWRGAWDSARVFDPNQGREGKKYYSARGDANSTPIRWWTDTILVRPGGKLPIVEEAKR